VAAIQSDEILDVLKRVAQLLREADIEFALGGGLSARIRGGPPTEHDVIHVRNVAQPVLRRSYAVYWLGD
jgi:hypothetical protein